MSNRTLTKEFIYYALLLVAFVLAGTIILFILLMFTYQFARPLLDVIDFFRPHDSGLADHMRRAMTVAAMLSILAYVALLAYFIKKYRSKTAITWIFAAVVEFGLMFTSLVDRSISRAPYAISNYAMGWWQLAVLVVVVAGYIYFMLRNKDRPNSTTQKAWHKLDVVTLLAVLLSSFILCCIAFVITNAWLTMRSGTGLERYVGLERQVAQEALAFSRSTQGPAVFTTEGRVVNLWLDPPQGACNTDVSSPDVLERTHYYVVIEEPGLFGIGGRREGVQVCVFPR